MSDYGVIKDNYAAQAGIFNNKTLQGACAYMLSDSIVSKEMFLRSACDVLPFDPPIDEYCNSWDAFSDSLWGGFHSLEMPNIVVFWPNSEMLKKADHEAYAQITGIFDFISKTIRDPKYGNGRIKNFLALLS